MILLVRYTAAFVIALCLGKALSKCRLPAILGWLIAGMAVGPFGFTVLNSAILETPVYETLMRIIECTVGLLIGSELVWKKIKAAGMQIFITTLTQSVGTFLIVSLVFALAFYTAGIPVYIAFILGGIALATAPAPALSIVQEFKTNGPVTKTLIPMAVLDDMVGVVIFFTVIAAVKMHLAAGAFSPLIIPLIIVLPLFIGGIAGVISGFIMQKTNSLAALCINLCISITAAAAIGIYVNTSIFAKPVLNFMLIGMAYSALFSNMIPEEKLEKLMHRVNPVISLAMTAAILNLGAPLNYRLIFGAGFFTFLYIASRAAGKYFGARFGAALMHSPEPVKKYLGLTLLPHSGVSLVFTGIAVSVLSGSVPQYAQLIQGTIAAAAVINEIIAVIAAKKGFELAGEITGRETLQER
ncbi:cation:proton antiporter [Treponema pedis]|uniref:cation:proton antiporter n=1 Tax=Treponema pedis TaxID=409322 RepID=UPI0003FFFA4F|nr:cation:proton antiporter [Treponema pedis]